MQPDLRHALEPYRRRAVFIAVVAGLCAGLLVFAVAVFVAAAWTGAPGATSAAVHVLRALLALAVFTTGGVGTWLGWRLARGPERLAAWVERFLPDARDLVRGAVGLSLADGLHGACAALARAHVQDASRLLGSTASLRGVRGGSTRQLRPFLVLGGVAVLASSVAWWWKPARVKAGAGCMYLPGASVTTWHADAPLRVELPLPSSSVGQRPPSMGGGPPSSVGRVPASSGGGGLPASRRSGLVPL